MEIVSRLIALVFLALPLAAPAQTNCFEGDGGTGSLEFRGAVEGTEFTGQFGSFSVRYCMSEGEAEKGSIEVEVDLVSAESGNRDRDTELAGEAFFAVQQHPVSTWRSENIVAVDNGYVADGKLTLKGITASQSIRFTLAAEGDSLVAAGSFVLAGDADVDRQRFEVGTGEFADPEFVRNRVDVLFSVTMATR